jgi:peptidyl-prolyl cis-trans isomerase B (cyclophilin B)
VPSNEQRRAAAKRKLERQIARRAEQARRRKQLTIAGSVLGVVVVVAAGFGIYYLTHNDDSSKNSASASSTTTDASLSNTPQAAPPPNPNPRAATVSCNYRDGGEVSKKVDKPQTAGVSTVGSPKVSIDSTQGPIGITLNPAEAPCTVNSFVSLVKQHYFDNAPCHRLSTEGLKMLQCGDPTGTGKGGPGYEFDNEYPTDQYGKDDPAAQNPVLYKRGVVAMANAGTDPSSGGTNGSQFFLIDGDSPLPPQYTIFGTVDAAGLKTLDKIAAGGDDHSMDSSAGGGKPKLSVTFKSVTVG